MIKLKDVRGGEKLLSLWWFFVLGVIGGGIVIGVMIFSAADTSVNFLEADILGERILSCIIDNGHLIDYDNQMILEKCNLDEKMFVKGSDFYFKIQVYNGGELVEEKSFEKGDFSFEKECKVSLKDEVDARYFPKCFFKRAKVWGSDNNEILDLILLTGSNQKGEKGVFKK